MGGGMLAESLTGKPAPELSNLRGWINTSPLTMEGLKGKVVLLDFWTYSCVNCVRSLPHMKLLHKEYAGDAFVLIGVHTPEFEFEKPPENVASAVKRFGIGYPVAIDSENTTWKLYGNQYWPRQTVVDSKGTVRWEHAGEGDYDKMEDRIRDLLKEVGKQAESKGNTRTNTIERFAFSSKTTPEIYTAASGFWKRTGMRAWKLYSIHRPSGTLARHPVSERRLDAISRIRHARNARVRLHSLEVWC